jgi:hypothetical protein
MYRLYRWLSFLRVIPHYRFMHSFGSSNSSGNIQHSHSIHIQNIHRRYTFGYTSPTCMLWRRVRRYRWHTSFIYFLPPFCLILSSMSIDFKILCIMNTLSIYKVCGQIPDKMTRRKKHLHCLYVEIRPRLKLMYSAPA